MRTWRAAMEDALYGPRGFYRSPAAARRAFATSVTVSAAFADAVAALLAAVDEQLGEPQRLDLVDVGSSDGHLLEAVVSGPGLSAGLRKRLRLTAVDRSPGFASDPAACGFSDPAVRRTQRVPSGITGLVVANELLDNVPVDVVQVDASGVLRTVLVDDDGAESLGPSATDEMVAWLDQWWPMDAATGGGSRAEIGTMRDDTWRDVISRLHAGTAIAIDYGHTRAERVSGRFAAGTLTAYRDGRQLPAVPDGRHDLTAHVALDSCAAAGEQAGAQATRCLSQRAALARLLPSRSLPDRALARADPGRYVWHLQRASEMVLLRDPAGLGSFTWLIQSKSMDVPAVLR